MEILVSALLLLGVEALRAGDSAPSRTLADYSVTNWTEADGPFPFGIYAIAQDTDGFLWLGARTGLIRFDGVNFVIWNERVQMPKGRVSAVCASKGGAVWVAFGSAEGISRIDKDRVTNYGPREGLPGGYVLTLMEDRNGTIWAGGYGGLSRFRDGRWQAIGPFQGLPTEVVEKISEDKSGAVWVASRVGLYRRAATEDVFRFVASDLVHGLSEDDSGAIWVTDPAFVFKRLDDATSSALLTRQHPAVGIGRALIEDRHGNLWIGTSGNGLMFVPKTSDKLHRVVERLRARDGLVGDQVRTLFEDRDGNIWIGTHRGLSRLFESNVTQLRIAGNKNPFIYAVASSSDGGLWMATGEGLLRIHEGRTRRYGVGDGLPGPVITALHEDRLGRLWVATTSGIARSTGTGFSRIRFPEEMGIEQISSITTDRRGRTWLCDNRHGVVRWQDGKLEFLDQGLGRNTPHVVYTDGRDRVWVGFWNGGLDVHDDETVVSYAARDGLPSGGVNVIHGDTTGTVWVGTTEGLAQFAGGRFRTFTTNGFPRSDVRSIIEDSLHNFWFGLDSGLLRVSRDELARAAADSTHQLRYRIFGREDGLPGMLARPGMPNSARAGDGSLYFLTSLGVARVRTDHLMASPRAGPLRIEGIVADGRPLLPFPGLQIPPRRARIEINYSILSLTGPSSLRFRYKLEGFDPDWEDAGSRRQARYTNLPPGKYRFRVVHGSSERGWNEPGAALEFSIQPAFYQSLGFYIACAALIVLATAGGWRVRLRLIQRRFELVLAERTRVARDIHDTLLQSLAAAALDFDDISSQLDPAAEALRAQVTHARERVEHYVREARQAIWNLRSPALEDSGLVQALRDVGELATSGKPVKFECIVRGTPSRIVADVEEQLLRIGQEALTNAVRHANASTIRIELLYEGSSLTLRVSDDGHGFDLEHAGSTDAEHWGLTNMRDRAQRVGASFNVVSREGKGTTVEAVVPLLAVA